MCPPVCPRPPSIPRGPPGPPNGVPTTLVPPRCGEASPQGPCSHPVPPPRGPRPIPPTQGPRPPSPGSPSHLEQGAGLAQPLHGAVVGGQVSHGPLSLRLPQRCQLPLQLRHTPLLRLGGHRVREGTGSPSSCTGVSPYPPVHYWGVPVSPGSSTGVSQGTRRCFCTLGCPQCPPVPVLGCPSVPQFPHLCVPMCPASPKPCSRVPQCPPVPILGCHRAHRCVLAHWGVASVPRFPYWGVPVSPSSRTWVSPCPQHPPNLVLGCPSVSQSPR